MATTTEVPVDVYLRSSYEPDAEYVDGRIEERPLGEFDHALWQEAILAWFREHRYEWHVRALPELRIKVAAAKYRVPDVTLLDRSQPAEKDHYPPTAGCLRDFIPGRHLPTSEAEAGRLPCDGNSRDLGY